MVRTVILVTALVVCGAGLPAATAQPPPGPEVAVRALVLGLPAPLAAD